MTGSRGMYRTGIDWTSDNSLITGVMMFDTCDHSVKKWVIRLPSDRGYRTSVKSSLRDFEDVVSHANDTQVSTEYVHAMLIVHLSPVLLAKMYTLYSWLQKGQQKSCFTLLLRFQLPDYCIIGLLKPLRSCLADKTADRMSVSLTISVQSHFFVEIGCNSRGGGLIMINREFHCFVLSLD